MTDVITPTDLAEGDTPEEVAREAAPAAKPRPGFRARRKLRTRKVMMRPRKLMVKLHRWLGLGLFVWLVIVSFTGSWLVVHDAGESIVHPDRYDTTPGDVGVDKAFESAGKAMGEGVFVSGVTLPRNGRGVYQVYGEIAPEVPEDAPEDFVSEEPYVYLTAFVDPGSGNVNEVRNESEGLSWWMYRGHMYLWQDFGLFGMDDPQTGACRMDDGGHYPGSVLGVVCDVMPDGMDMIGWFSLGFIFLLVGGFYLWYWPGVRRWATAFVIKRGRGRFTFQMSVHKVVGFVVWVPLLIVAFTGAAFAFPNMNSWYENATPANRDLFLWEHPEDLVSSEADGRDAIGIERAVEIFRERYPDRAVNYVGMPYDETGMYESWTTRGFDPWTREGGAGNTLVTLDQYTGETLYDGSPEDGNVYDQAWDDWSFPLHAGDFFGTTSRVAWTILGITPIVLGVTGLIMWFVRRNKRKKRVPLAAPVAAASTEDAPVST